MPPNATEEDCEQVIQMVSYLEDAAPWWRGDAILQAEALHGEKYAQWVDIFCASEGYLRNLVWVCSVFPPEDRHPGRSYKHHQAVASVPDRERRLALLEEAYQEGLSADELYERALGERLVLKRANPSDKGYQVHEEVNWAEFVGVRGLVVETEDAYWLSYHGGMAKIADKPESK